MNGWQFFDKLLDRLPSWPTERQWVTIGLFSIVLIMLQMGVNNPKLWEVKLFEILIQGFALTGLLNMVSAFHFSANKGDETRAENTGKAFDTMKTLAEGSPSNTASNAANEVAEAAKEKSEEFQMPHPVDYNEYKDLNDAK